MRVFSTSLASFLLRENRAYIYSRQLGVTATRWKSSVVQDIKLTDRPNDHSLISVAGAGDKRLDFSDARLAYQSKTNAELARALIVFKICSSKFIVDRNQQLMEWGQKILGQRLFEKLMRRTFFGQFCGGGDERSLADTVKTHAEARVRAMLHYCVEQDSDPAGTHSLTAAEALLESGVTPIPGLRSVRLWDAHWANNKTCIDGVAATTDGTGIAQLKITGMCDPDILEKVTTLIRELRAWFTRLSRDLGQGGRIETIDVDRYLAKLNVPQETRQFWIREFDSNNDGIIDETDWTATLSKSVKFSQLLYNHGEIKTSMEENEVIYLDEVLNSFNVLIQHAERSHVTVALDAEQSWFREGIDAIAQELMSKYNTNKESLRNVCTMLRVAERGNFGIGLKVVRGAYMEQEAERAEMKGLENPINPTYEATNQMYDGVLSEIFTGIDKRGRHRVAVLICTHNEDSIHFSLNKLHETGLSPSDESVRFAQLFGMCDFLTYPIGHAGYQVYKSIPYGPIQETLPYLSRRACENQSVFNKVKKERRMIWSEFCRRMRAGEWITYQKQPKTISG